MRIPPPPLLTTNAIDNVLCWGPLDGAVNIVIHVGAEKFVRLTSRDAPGTVRIPLGRPIIRILGTQ